MEERIINQRQIQQFSRYLAQEKKAQQQWKSTCGMCRHFTGLLMAVR